DSGDNGSAMLSRMRLHALVVIASAGWFACGDNATTNGFDARVFDAGAGSSVDAAPHPDGPIVTTDAPLGIPDGPVATADAPRLVDAGIPDAFDTDAGLAVVMSFPFTSDPDNFMVSFADPGADMTWHGDDGDPPGSLVFTSAFTSNIMGAVKVTFLNPVT